MDAISYSYADKQAKRIKNVIADPDSTSGVLTVPKTIASGENITIPSGRVAVLPNVQIDGTLNVQGDVFIPSGATLSSVVEKVASTDNAVVRFDGTTGEVQNSGVIIDDDNSLYINNSNSGSTRGLTVGGATKRILIGYDGTNNKGVINSADFGTIQTPLSLQGYELTFNTGIYNTVERMRIDTAGRVGLGTTTPTTTLDVVGNGRFQQQATSGTSGAIIIKEDSGSVNGGVIQWVNPATTLQRAAINVKPDFSWEISNSNSLMFKISTVGDFLATLGTGGLGYGTGAGGTVTQLTSKSTSVTLNKPTGKIIMNNAALAAGAGVSFGVANSLITTSDNIIISHQSVGAGNGTYSVGVDSISNGSFGVYVKNTSGGSLSEAIILNFTIIKGAIS